MKEKNIKSLLENALVENDMVVANPSLSEKENRVREEFIKLMKDKGLETDDYEIKTIDDVSVFFILKSPEKYIMKAVYNFMPEDNKVEFDTILFKKEMDETETTPEEDSIEDVKVDVVEDLEEGRIYKAVKGLNTLTEKKISRYLKGIKNKKRIGFGEKIIYDNPKVYIRQSAKELIASYDDKLSSANNSLYLFSLRDCSNESILFLK